MVQEECHGARRVPWCKKRAMVQEECHGARRVPWCKKSAMVQEECHGARRVPWCKKSAMVHAPTRYLGEGGSRHILRDVAAGLKGKT
jgi:hypothetical protein